MNIIKFKDIVRLGDDLFNQYLKGKYAYWIHMRYAVPFDLIDRSEYVAMENDITLLLDPRKKRHYWDLQKKNSDILAFVDNEGTEAANNIMPFIRSNRFTTDQDITLEEVKVFRAWLADTLLEFDRNDSGKQKCQFYTDQFTRVLEYYRNSMYDQTVKALAEIKPFVPVDTPNLSDCGCSSKTIIGLNPTNVCEPLNIYRKHIYGLMVEKFSDVEFWMQYPYVFLCEFKAYIDNIIRLNLPLATSPYKSNFVDCPCLDNTAQLANMDILERLSKSLGYLIEDDKRGHINFINKAFTDWSTQLYESMQWG